MSADVLVVAAGSGSRIGAEKNKMFWKIRQTPILHLTLQQLSLCPDVTRIFTVIRKSDEEQFHEMIAEYPPLKKLAGTVWGGAERHDSVRVGLRRVLKENPAEVVMVHDGARPFFSADLMSRLYRATIVEGAAIPILPVTETVRQKMAGKTKIIDRQTLFRTQTPQAFLSRLAFSCFLSDQATSVAFTDDASYLEHQGHEVAMIPGENANIKITTLEDLQYAEYLIQKQVG